MSGPVTSASPSTAVLSDLWKCLCSRAPSQSTLCNSSVLLVIAVALTEKFSLVAPLLCEDTCYSHYSNCPFCLVNEGHTEWNQALKLPPQCWFDSVVRLGRSSVIAFTNCAPPPSPPPPPPSLLHTLQSPHDEGCVSGAIPPLLPLCVSFSFFPNSHSSTDSSSVTSPTSSPSLPLLSHPFILPSAAKTHFPPIYKDKAIMALFVLLTATQPWQPQSTDKYLFSPFSFIMR